MGKKLMFLTAMLILLPIGVDASIVEYNVCIPNSGAYHVSYNDEISTEVSRDKITNNDIISGNGHIAYPEGILESEKEKYSFTANRYALECTTTAGGGVSSCPTASQFDKYDVIDKYMYNRDSYILFSFNESTGKFSAKIIDAFNNKLSFRYVSDGRIVNEDNLNVSNYSGQLLSRTSFKDGNGNSVNGYIINNISGSTVSDVKFLTLEVYVNESECSGAYFATFTVPIPVTSTYEIKNPALTNPGSYGCTEVKNYHPEGMSSEEINGVLSELKKSIVSECYVDKIQYGEKSSLKDDISTNFAKLKSMFANYTNVTDSSSIICNNSSTNKKLVQTYTGRYWAMNVYEEYIAQGDEPKLVKAGSGFEYQTNYTIIRTSQIVQISKPTRAPQCQYSQAHGGCSWTRNNGTTGSGWDAGPNDNFDDCVMECDGGEYTQECINSCYKTVYDSGKDLSFSDKFINKNNSVVRTSSCTTENGRPGTQHQTGNDKFCVSHWCENHNYSCSVITTVSPDGCSDNPGSDYNSALNASLKELNEYKALQTSLVQAGEYEYQITDSYLKTADGKPYVYKVNSTTDPKVGISQSQSTSYSSPAVTVSLGNSGGATASYSATVEVTSKIVVSLPLSYVDKISGGVVYTSGVNASTAFSVNHNKSKFERLNFVSNRYYHDNGERKYYTNIWTPDLNVADVNGKLQLVRLGDYNIKVVSSKVGAGNFESDILCYYGVYNQFYDDEIQWIYRPIELTDVFPNNREPRWNWTGTLNSSNHTYTGAARFSDQTMMKYNIDPVRLTEDIESKGNAIFDVKKDSSEVDYEFVLTKENLQNIRDYNKNVDDYNGDGYNNYADYNMSCYKDGDGKEVCTSRFLDNINSNSGTETSSNFITYSVSGFTIDARKNIAGCNNSKSGACSELDG